MGLQRAGRALCGRPVSPAAALLASARRRLCGEAPRRAKASLLNRAAEKRKPGAQRLHCSAAGSPADVYMKANVPPEPSAPSPHRPGPFWKAGERGGMMKMMVHFLLGLLILRVSVAAPSRQTRQEELDTYDSANYDVDLDNLNLENHDIYDYDDELTIDEPQIEIGTLAPMVDGYQAPAASLEEEEEEEEEEEVEQEEEEDQEEEEEYREEEDVEEVDVEEEEEEEVEEEEEEQEVGQEEEEEEQEGEEDVWKEEEEEEEEKVEEWEVEEEEEVPLRPQPPRATGSPVIPGVLMGPDTQKGQ
ncbi:hypothetical protein ANANG_G00144950 [Anguilla anguilla]|uniref:Uncharacterized protein n=1 Tax=Anguilla anguilla TaxID=7936 RepID=A0A9D3RWR3_ANGAN|nr:hypothetical protein ANANG_G00144950 [Anguilla anguilla]